MEAMSGQWLDTLVQRGDIGRSFKTIDEIAFQTNILALNAGRRGS